LAQHSGSVGVRQWCLSRYLSNHAQGSRFWRKAEKKAESTEDDSFLSTPRVTSRR